MYNFQRLVFLVFLIKTLVVYTQGVTALDAQKGVKVYLGGGQLQGNGFNNADIKTIGSPFFHENWIPTLFKEKKISVKYDAFNSQMITSNGQMLIPFDGISLKLENGETWLTFNKKWYKLINQKNDFTFLIKPYVKYKPRVTSRTGYQEDKPAEFVLTNQFFMLKKNSVNLLSKKEVRKYKLKKK